MHSYWEQKHFIKYHNIIVGAGVSGLFSAVNLKRKFPHERVLIVSKDLISCGASTKNAGFACMGSLSELEDDIKTSSQDEVCALFEKRYNGLQVLRNELGDQAIDYQEKGSYELISKHNVAALEKISKWNTLLKGIGKGNAFGIGRINDFDFKGFEAIVKNNWEGAIDSGLMIYSLIQKAKNLGVEFMTNTEIKYFESTTEGYKLFDKDENNLLANRLILCTNAFANELVPALEIKPARGQVLITKPIKGLKIKGTYHFDCGYYYFREIDGRVLFGGGRQLDFNGEATTTFGQNKTILEDLKLKLKNNILPQNDFEIDATWSGIMGFSKSKHPVCKRINSQLYALAGFGGMGVALAPLMAKELVELID